MNIVVGCSIFNFAVVQRADRRADKYITVFPYLCRKKEGLTAGGQPIAPSRLKAYASDFEPSIKFLCVEPDFCP